MTPSATGQEQNIIDADMDAAFGPGRLMLLLGVMVFICFPDIVLGTHTFVYRDAGLFSYPLAYYVKYSFLHGEWPLWNPYSNCGLPFLAQWNTLALYPFSIVNVLLPMPWSLNYLVLAHVFLAGAGMYFLAWRWSGSRFAATLAGLVFAWNGASMDILMWPAAAAAVAWMPWVVLLCDRAVAEGGRAIFWAALAGACQMLTGSPETILCTWLMLAPICVAQSAANRQSQLQSALRLGVVVVLVTALSAAQLLPWLQLVAHGDRSSAYGGDRWSLPAWGAANFLVPLFRHSPSVEGVFWQPGQEFFSSYYVGIVTVVFAVLALTSARRGRHVLLLALMAVMAFSCACGDAGYVLPLVKKIVPWLGFLRYPVKFLVITLFCLPLLAATGARQLQTGTFSRRRMLLAGLAVTLGLLYVLAVARRFPFPDEQWNVTARSGWTRLGFLVIALVILVKRRPTALAGFALLLLTGADICTNAPRQNPTAPVRAYDSAPPPMSSLPQLGQSRALIGAETAAWLDHLANPSPFGLYLGQRAELAGNCNLLERIPKVDGFFPVYLRDQSRVAALLSSHGDTSGLEAFLGVSQVTSATKLFTWEARTNFLPMASIGQQPRFADDATVLRELTNGFDPRKTVFLPLEAQESVPIAGDATARVISSKVTPSLCQFETQASRPAMLVVAQSWYPCWKAEMDGQPRAVLRANGAFQAVVVPAGRHTVRLIYDDRLFHWGGIVSLVSLAVCALGLFRRTT